MKRFTLALLGAILAALLLAGPASAAPIEVGSFNLTPQSWGAAVAVDESTGDVFIASEANDAVERFHHSGSGWSKVGEVKGSETSAGSFSFCDPQDQLAIDQATGNLYVGSICGESVIAFGPNTSLPSGYEELWTAHPGGFPLGLAVDPQGQPWASNGGTVKQLSASTGAPTGEEYGVASPNWGIAFDLAGALYSWQESNLGVNQYVGGQYAQTIEPGAYAASFAPEAGGNLFEFATVTSPSFGRRLLELSPEGTRLSETVLPNSFANGGPNITVDAARHRLFISTAEDAKVHVFAIPAPLPININGQGSVQCGEAGFTEPCGSFLPGEVVKLVATPETGYAFAGWIGCMQTGENTCEVTVGESTEVTAIFLKEAESAVLTPFSGNQHGCSNGGLEITVGTTHSYLCNGSDGTNGQNGAQGPEGKQGPQGPAGKVSVTCKVKQKGKKVKVTCTVKQSASASSVHWRLMRAGHACRHGVARHGRLSLGALSSGHYRLLVEGQKGATEIVIG